MSVEDLTGHILATLSVVAALLTVHAVNVRKRVRVRQFVLPFGAFIYGVLATVLYFSFAQVLSPLSATTCATGVLLIFAIVKVIMRPVTAGWTSGSSFPGSAIVAEFYEFDGDHSLWFVKRRLGDLRSLLRAVYWGSVVVVVSVFLLDATFAVGNGNQGLALLILPALVLGECFFAVDGLTKAEFEREFIGEEDNARRIAHYGGLARVLAETFGDRLIALELADTSADAAKTYERLDALQHSSDDVDRLAALYFQRVKQQGERLDANLVDTAVGLMHSTSAVITNPFYPDLTRYLVFPAYYHLLQYRKVLIVAGRDAIAHDLVAWMSAGLEEITGVPQLWEVGVLGRHGRDTLDVGVLRFADLHNLDLIRSNDDFLASVEYVILAEPAQQLATGQLGLGLVLSRCGRDGQPVFVAFDRNHDGLVDALSHLFKTNVTDVVASASPTGTSVGAVWRSDGPNMTAAIFPRVTRYLGMGTEIAAVALKHQVSQVTWVGAERFPVVDTSWIAGQYHQQINTFAELDVSQQVLTDSIVPWPNPWNLPQSDNRFLVIEDEFANVYESIRLYATRARNQGFVNLISDDYLLRDYMVANSDIFSADAKAIPSIVSDFARTERNSVLRLMLAMSAFEVSATALAKELEIIGVPGTASALSDRPSDEDPTELAVIKALVAEHTGTEPSIVSRWDPPVEDPDALPQRSYRLQRGAKLDGIVDALRPAYFFVEDEVEDQNYIGALLFCHVYQTVLPGQFVTFAGKYYQVQGIGTAAYRNGVVLRRAAEHITDRRVYRQLRRYAIADLVSADVVGARSTYGDIELIRSYATLTVETDGFIELPGRSDLAGGKVVNVSGVPARRYSRKAVLQLRLPDVPPAVRRTIALLLNEVFVTVFPQAHPYVVAITTNDDAELASLLPGLTVDDDAADGAIFIVEDSLVDLGLTVAVERNWERLFAIITDYLAWRADGDATTADDIHEPIAEDVDAPE